MTLLLFILIPFFTAFLLLFIKNSKSANLVATLFSVLTFIIALYTAIKGASDFDQPWIPILNSRFLLHAGGASKILVLLTAISFPAIFISTSSNVTKQNNIFLSLLLFTQSGLMGVFLAGDALLFYFFWELALIPVYFLSSIWGGEKRIAVTFKFFIYTFLGSLLMLIGIILVYMNTPDHSFLLTSFVKASLSKGQQITAFILFFIAFAVKMPIFPFHTWQPDAYEQSPTALTMVLSAVMAKMGLYGVICWLLPLFPMVAKSASFIIVNLSIIGVIYASFIAIRQDDIKRLIAYSSIAHIGLMSAALFTNTSMGMQGVLIQLFSHGINVIGLWVVASILEQQTGTRSMKEMGGLAKKQPTLAILLVGFALANIALPLTNSFVGEFLIFNSLFQFNIGVAVAAGISIVLSAIYTLNMIQKIVYGEVSTSMDTMTTINKPAQGVLLFLLVIVFVTGVYPQPLFSITADTVQHLFVK